MLMHIVLEAELLFDCVTLKSKKSTFLTTQRTFYSFYSVRKESISAGAAVTALLF